MVWADAAEQLKQELTDKYVVVMEGVPELRRFAGRTGTVKTVNMSGRALVQFEAPADISWYDIDPSYLTVIDAPLPKKQAEVPAENPTAEKPAQAKATATAKGGLSPLELARQQGAAKAADAAAPPTKAAPTAPVAEDGQKLSPLELARQQGAAKSGGSPPPVETQPASAPASGGAGLSPLELARQQGAAKQPSAEEPPGSTEAADASSETPTPAEPSNPPVDTTGMSKLELARMQGPFKG